MTFSRPQVEKLLRRLAEPRGLLQVVAGPRQCGKTTVVRQALAVTDLPHRYATADSPLPLDAAWIEREWNAGRKNAAKQGGVLVLDEIQKITGWSEAVKRLWDEDRADRADLRVVILGSAPLLLQHGLSESLAGRFETIRMDHWSYPEMQEAFGYTLDEFLYFGGYPGAAPLRHDFQRWRDYLLDSLIETTLSRDILLLHPVRKPALLRRLFLLGCEYSGQILSFNKMLGQLQDAGNTTTLAHYLELLDGAGMLAGLPKFSTAAFRRRASSPKLIIRNTGLMNAVSGRSFEEAKADPKAWGRIVETAVGAHLLATAHESIARIAYWREQNLEVDFVVTKGDRRAAIEVKSVRSSAPDAGVAAFATSFEGSRCWHFGPGGVPLQEVLTSPAGSWLE